VISCPFIIKFESISNRLSDTFSIATFGNGVVAIIAGLAASFVAEQWGYVSPFMVSLILLVIGTIVVGTTWKENYGDSSADIASTFSNAISVMRNDIKIPILGLTQSLFEASMYTFVFMWTPALQYAVQHDTIISEQNEPLPFGLIFAFFIVSIMVGSTLFSLAIAKLGMSPESIARVLFGVAVVSLIIPAVSTSVISVFTSFLIFEICCGLYFPCLGTLRGKYIPEHTRAAVMNFFRLPLNILVVAVLTRVGTMENETVFYVCAGWMVVAFLLMNQLLRMTPSTVREFTNEHVQN